MNLREKYGEWGVIYGGAEGLGRAFCEKLAKEGMNVVVVDYQEEKLLKTVQDMKDLFGVDSIGVTCDLSQKNSVEKVFEVTDGLDVGFMSYVACLHSFGKFQDIPWEKHVKMLNVNIYNFLEVFYHYMSIFAKRDRGAIINISSLTAISSSPWNSQYGAGKSYILKLTEAVAGEAEKTNVDVMAITLGTTITPSLLKNIPGGDSGSEVMARAASTEDVVEEAFEKLGKELSVIQGDINKANVHNWKANHTEDEYIRYMGSFYSD